MKIKKVKPLFTSVLTTMDKYIDPQYITGTNIIDTSKQEGGLKEYQTVVAVGDMVRSVKVGDLVCIDPSNYEVRKFEDNTIKKDLMENNIVRYNFKVIETIEGSLLHLQERDISFIIEELSDDKTV